MTAHKGDGDLLSVFRTLYAPEMVRAFIVQMGPPPPPLTRWQRTRLRVRRLSHDARAWLARNVLRLRIDE